MAKSWRIPFFSVFSITVVLVVACIVIALQKGKSSTETVEFSKGPLKTEDDFTAVTVNSTKGPKANNPKIKDHHRRFCRKCCQTPPCWYNNHKECSKCLNQKNTKQIVATLLRRSHTKAVHHHQRGQQRLTKHKAGRKL